MPLIETKNLSFRYDDKVILQDINLKLNQCGLIVLLGESGSGKSTFLHILAGFITSFTGVLNVVGQISISFQSHNLLKEFNVLENVAMPLIANGKDPKESYREANDILESIGGIDLRERQIKELSGGQLARVSIARSLCSKPEIILLDEPTGALDSFSAQEIMKLLKEISKNHLIIMVTHQEKLATTFASKIYRLLNHDLVLDKNQDEQVSILQNSNEVSRTRNISLYQQFVISWKIFIKRKARFFVAIVFVALSLSMLEFTVKFCLDSPISIKEATREIYNYSLVKVTNEIKTPIPNSPLSITQYMKPSENQIKKITEKSSTTSLISLDMIIGTSINLLNVAADEIKLITLEPFFDKSPSQSAEEVIVNKNFLKTMSLNNENLEDFRIPFKTDLLISTIIGNISVREIIPIEIEFKIKDISEEDEFLNRPTIYYNYNKLFNFLDSFSLSKASQLLKYDFSLLDRLTTAGDEDPLLGNEILIVTDDPYRFNQRIVEDFKGMIVRSKAMDIYKDAHKIINNISQVILIFISFILVCSSLLEFIIIKSLYEEEEKTYAIFYSFKLHPKNFKAIFYGIAKQFVVWITILSVFFTRIAIFISNRIFISNGVYSLFSFKVIEGLDIVILLLATFLTYLGVFSSYKTIIKKELIKSLREE